MGGPPPRGTAPAATGRRGAVTRVVAAVLAVVAVFALADLGTAAAAESRISRTMRDRMHLPEDPAVRVHGLSFLAQAATGHYDRVDVTVQRVPIGPLRTPQIRVLLHDVRAPLSALVGSGPAEFRVDDVESTVRIAPTDIRRLVVGAGGPAATIEHLAVEQVEANDIDQVIDDGADPTLRGVNPRAAARWVAQMPVDGVDTRVAVLSTLVVEEGRLRIVPLDVRVDETNEPVPATVRDSLMHAMAVEVDPGTLPLDITATSATIPEYNVLEISGTAHDVEIGAGGQAARHTD